MLPHTRRVSRIQFEKTLKDSKVFHGASFSLRVGKNSQEIPAKAAVIVSKKIDTRATKRNALRRKGYHALGSLLALVKPGHVLLFFAKKGAETKSEQALAEDIKNLINLIQ
jgi:ribonuclease P protein component